MNQRYSRSYGLYHGILSGLIGGLWLAAPIAASTTLTVDSTDHTIQIAQASLIEPAASITITGRLDRDSLVLPDGNYYQEHTFEGQAGEELAIQLSSDDFDTHLILKNHSNEIIAENNDGAYGTNSTIVVKLPTTGVYTLLATTFGEADIGSYKIEKRVATDNDRALVEAAQLAQQIYELYQSGQYTEAISSAERALSIRELALRENHPHIAESLNALAELYRVQGLYDKAEPLLQRAIYVYEQDLGENRVGIAQSLNNLALLYHDQSRYDEAEPLFQRSLSAYEQALGEEHPSVAESLHNFAILHQAKGNFAEAKALTQRSLSIFEQALGEGHPNVARSLTNLAILDYGQGRLFEAESAYKQALFIYEQALGENHPDVARNLNNLALLYELQGRYVEAEPLFQQALDIFAQVLGESHPLFAQNLTNLARLYQTQGSYDKAEPLLYQSLSIYEQNIGEDHPFVAQSLSNIAELYRFQGSYAEAEEFHQRALSIYKKALGENHPFVATIINNIAELYRFQGSYAEAEEFHQRALSIRERTLDKNHPDIATSINNLANLHRHTGDYVEAESLYRQSLSMVEQTLGVNHPAVALSLNNLSSLAWSQGDITNAFNLLKRSLSVEDATLNLNIVGGSEAYKQKFLDTFSDTKNAIISLHLQDIEDSPDSARLALYTILQRKGRLIDIFTSSQRVIREQLNPESQSLLNELDSKRTQLSMLFYSQLDVPSLKEYRSQIDRIELEIEQLEDQLSRRSSQFQSINQSAQLSDVQALLPKRTTLVELIQYQPFNPTAEGNNWVEEERYAAYVMQSNGTIEGIDLGTVSDIDPLIASMQRSVRNSRFTLDEVKEAARALDEKIMAPVRARIGESSHLLLSPDGAFNLIPFEALVDEQGNYLVENYTLTYLTSGRDLLRLQTTAEAQTEPLLLANPIFEQPGSTKVAQIPTRYASLRERSWTALLGTAQEANRIATSARVPQERNLQGIDATEAALKRVDRPRFLHIATHGFFEPANTGEVPITDNPLLRSGLVLSGINLGQSGAEEDGIVSALEVSSLNLVGTQLAVLSACETGLGDLSVGEGVYGLRRALVLAGSESQLISLWRVQDDTTRDLMAAYYEHLMSGLGRSEAMRHVQLEMLKDEATAHPYYWAAFINSGNWLPISDE